MPWKPVIERLDIDCRDGVRAAVGRHGKLDGNLGCPEVIRPTPAIPQNGFNVFAGAPTGAINPGRDADAGVAWQVTRSAFR